MCAKPKYKCKPYEMTNQGHDLCAALLQWRDFKMIEEDLDGNNFFGPQLIMSNKTLNHIIDLAHYAKLSSPASLLEQTGWCYSLEYGIQIIKLVQSYFPPPPPLPPPPIHPPPLTVLGPSIKINQLHSAIQMPAPQIEPTADAARSNAKQRAARKCRAYGSNLHIGMCS